MQTIGKAAGAAALAIAAAATGTASAVAPAPPPPVVTPTAPPAPPPVLPPLPNGTAVRIAFAPPLDRPIRYLRIEEKTGGGTTKRISMRLVVRFTKVADGYLMEGRTEIPDLPPQLAGSPETKLALRPITFRLDRDGALVGIEKEEEYWQAVDAIVDRLGAGPKARPGDKALYRSIFRSMRALPAANRLALIAQNFLPITAFGSVDMAVGQTGGTPEQESRLPLPGVSASIKRHDEVTLTEATTSTATFESIARLDEGAMAGTFEALRRLAPKPRPPEPAPKMTLTAETVVSRRFGLTLLYTEHLDAEAPGGEVASRAISLRASW